MGRLLVWLVMLAALTILAVQNLSPAIPLVVLSSRTIALPLSFWLLGAIAIGALTTLLLYSLSQLAAPSRRPYRPMGQRLSSPPPDDDRVNRFSAATAERSNSRSESPSPSAYDTDWESFRAPEQWDDWEQRPEPDTVAQSTQGRSAPRAFQFKRQPYSAADTVDEIESGWETYETYAEDGIPYQGVSPVEETLDDIAAGWEAEAGPYPPSAPTDYEPEEFETDDDQTDGVYDADYRVIIPPYKPPEEKG